MKPELPPIQVIHEDNHLLVVNKPAGLLVHGDQTNDENLVDICKEYIRRKYHKPGKVFLGLPHRLDRPVSGIVVLARTSKALDRINEQFRNKEIEKIYWAITLSTPPEMEGRLEHWLVKDRKKNLVTITGEKKREAVKAVLKYKVIGKISDENLLEIKLLTGRFHQIRVQLKAIGCPIKGDVKYGSSQHNRDGSICLHGRKLKMKHPVQKMPVTFTAELPKDNWSNYLSFDT